MQRARRPHAIVVIRQYIPDLRRQTRALLRLLASEEGQPQGDPTGVREQSPTRSSRKAKKQPIKRGMEDDPK
jgi:hypothetical protein